MKNSEDFPFSSKERLVKLAFYKMPYGKYKGQYLSDIPEAYFIWLRNQGLPKGLFGEMLSEIIEIKTNGLEYLLREIRKKIIRDNPSLHN